MSSHFTVVYDACTLYPAPLRDLLMHLALSDLFRARWSNMIHDEWIRNVHANRPDLNLERLERTRAHMNQAVFAFRRYEDASLSYTGIDSHEGLRHFGLYDTVVARE